MGGCMCESTGHPMGVHVGPRVWAHVCGGGPCVHIFVPCVPMCVHVCMCACPCVPVGLHVPVHVSLCVYKKSAGVDVLEHTLRDTRGAASPL